MLFELCTKQSNPVRNTLMIVGGVLGMLLLFSIVLRAALAPLYEDVTQMQQRDAEAWAAAMGKLLREPARSVDMARAGVAKLERDFTKEKWLERIEAIYNEVLRIRVSHG
jgi:glycosyltransferase involved in cell wall biosynthesis